MEDSIPINERFLGEGTVGRVWAIIPPGGEPYACKRYLPWLLSDPRQVESMRNGMNALRAIRHPSILAIASADQEGIKMALASSSLADIIRNGPTDTLEVKRIVQEIALALDHVGRSGICHGNLKPKNVLLDASGKVLLADFAMGSNLLHSGSISEAQVETLLYLAPERFLEGSVSASGDVYSLAALTFHLLSGRPPFNSRNPVKLTGHHCKDEVPSIRAFRPEITEAIERVLLRGLKKAPADRFRSPGEFATALTLAVDDVDIRESSVETSEGDTDRVIVNADIRSQSIAAHSRFSAETPVESNPKRTAIKRQKSSAGLIIVILTIATLSGGVMLNESGVRRRSLAALQVEVSRNSYRKRFMDTIDEAKTEVSARLKPMESMMKGSQQELRSYAEQMTHRSQTFENQVKELSLKANKMEREMDAWQLKAEAAERKLQEAGIDTN